MERVETRTFVVELSESEIAERAEQMSQSIIAQRPLVSERKRVNEAIKELEEEVESLADVIHAGAERREVECEWLMKWSHGIMLLRRTDNGQIVSVKPITEEMRQMPMFVRSRTPRMMDHRKHEFFELDYIFHTCWHTELLEESNVTICVDCGAVLERKPITRSLQPRDN